MFLQAFLPNVTQFLERTSRALVLSVIAEHVNASFRVIPFRSEHPDAVERIFHHYFLQAYQQKNK